MFVILPYSAEVRHEKTPWIVILVSLLCLGIYLLQDSRNESIGVELEIYCESIHDANLDDESLDVLRKYKHHCTGILSAVHGMPYKERFDELFTIWVQERQKNRKSDDKLNDEQVEDLIRNILGHYQQALSILPPSLDAALKYDPKVIDPIRSVLSALSHADWWHLIGNMIFFFAFATAIEYIIASSWKFILSMIAIELFCDITYSITVALGAAPFPTLGLSGVVAGMIGMSAYLMPNVRVRTFVWFFHFARTIYVPAAVLAVWYIGWDTYYLMSSEWSSGINLVAHVSAGFAGYLMARIWFRKRREETKDEVDDEVEYMRSLRHDKLGIMSSYRSKGTHISDVMAADRAKRNYAAWVDRIHVAINTNQDSEAINYILSRYDEYRYALELYDELYQEMLKWRHTRAILCMSRLLIGEYIESRKYANAIDVAQTAYHISDQFVFGDDKQRELLSAMAERQGVVLTL
jgi:membrane associated rhomboid family serine protease